MSIEMMAWALDVVEIPAAEKLVLIGIASHADRDGDNAWPAIATLAGYANVSERQAQRLVRSLADRGLLVVDVGGGGTARTRDDRRPNLYRIVRGGVTSASPRQESRGDIQRADGVTSSASRGDTAMSPEPSLNRPRESSSSSSPVGFDEFWSTYPRKIAKPAALRAFKSAAKGGRHDAILDGLVTWCLAWKAAGTELSYIPHPATWLNQRRWEDKPSVAAAAQQPRAADGEIAEAIRQSAPFFEDAYPQWWQAAQLQLPHVLDVLGRWGFGVGESMIRVAIMRKRDAAHALAPVRLSRLEGVARFDGAPKAYMSDEPNWADSLRRAHDLQRWSNT